MTTLHRFDLSEHADESSVGRFLGAPPGEAGPDGEGQLFARLRATPGAVVLLEEVDKADPRVLELLLGVLDTGRLTSGIGRTADARDAVFVLTSTLGPGEDPERFAPPELRRRVDETIVFRALQPEDAVRILRPRLRALCETVERQHGVRLEVDPEAAAFITRTGFDPARGVRELRRTVERLVEAPLSSLILDGKIRRHPAWHVAYDEGGIYVVPRT